MITLLIPTFRRPRMLRTALRSIDRQTARDKLSLVIVSENGGDRDSAAVCAEFPSLPIKYIFRDPQVSSAMHGESLLAEACSLPHPYVADVHDDDWWGENHVANALKNLEAHPDASSYWCGSFFVHGEHSWFVQFWNISAWVATGYPKLTETAKLDLRQAALACLPSGPAHYSGLVARRDALAKAYPPVTKSLNEYDTDKLLFLELAKIGPVLLNHVPEVFVRQHANQDQILMPGSKSAEHVAAATRDVLAVCKELGIDVVREFEQRYDTCPMPRLRPYLVDIFDKRVMAELERQNLVPRKLLRKAPGPLARLGKSLCPPIVWNALTARRQRESLGVPV